MNIWTYFTNAQKPSGSSSASFFSWNLKMFPFCVFLIFFFFSLFFPHHHKQGCPPSWQGMEALWNWRRAGWSAALYGADKTPSGRPTLNKTSSIIFAGRASLSSLAVEALIYFWLPKKSANVLWWFARFWKCSFTIVCTLLHVLQPVSAAYNPSYIAALALPWATLSPQLYEIQNSPSVDGFLAANQRRRALLMNRQMGSRADRSIARNWGMSRFSITTLKPTAHWESHGSHWWVLNRWKRPECGGHGIKEWANIAKVVVDDDKTSQVHAWRRREIQSR